MRTFYRSIRPAWLLAPAIWLLGMSDALAQQGKTGAGNITTAGAIVNEYTNLTADVAAGATSITVASNTLNANNRFAAALAPGDLVMIIQMQGATINTTATTNAYGAVTAYNNAGKNELLEVRSVTGANTISFYCGTNNAYTANGRTQIVRIPRYTTLTLAANASLTAPAWNGTTGGIVAVEAQNDVTFNTNAAINATGLGFRGGAVHNVSTNPSAGPDYASTSNAYGGEKGESIAGYQADYDNLTGRYGRGAPANGGGGGNTHNAGGGGGANVGNGTWTGTGNPAAGYNNAWNQESANFAASTSSGGGRGGYSYSANNQDAATTPPGNANWGGDNRKNLGGQGGRPLATTGGLLFFGGGGGAGDSNDNSGTSGGNGGGLIYMLVGGNIVNAANATGTAIRANGATTGTTANDAPGGGGGGGTVVINVAGSVASVAISATGGVGGSQNLNTAEAEGPGGGGGGGYILYTTSSTASPATGTTAGAAGGTTNSPSLTEFIPNGATAGGTGIIATFTYAAQCALVADVAAAFTTAPTTATAGASVSYTVQFANNGPDVASGVTRTVTIPANAASSVSAPNATSVTGNQASGWTITYPGGTVATGTTSYTFSLVPAPNGGTFNLTAATTTTTNQGTNPTADSNTVTLTVNAVTVTGTVFEDVNYGGGAGRPATAAGTVGRPNATVEFYNSSNAYVGATTTGTNGTYSYNLPAAGTYTVRVVNSTVSSSRTGYVNTLVPVQTYNGTTTAVGGANPAFTDAGTNGGNQSLTALSSSTTTPQSIASVTASAGTTTGPSFGFNFDLVVNTNDAGQGSLRQFITNANALGGETSLAQAGSYTNPSNLATGSTAAGLAATALPGGIESSIFMIPTSALTNGVAVITPASQLPQLTGPNMAINGSTQTFNIGNTNDVLLGAGGTVGTQATALGQLNGPEVQLVGSTAIGLGLDVANTATNSRIRGLSVYGFGNALDNDGGANIRGAANTLTITQNVLGAPATSFTAPATLTNADDVRLIAGTSGITVSSNLIGFSNSKGISINTAVTNVVVTGNEIRSNGQASTNYDGLDINGNTATVQNNLFTGNSGQGIDSYRSAGSNVITGNTIIDNGRGTANLASSETPGVRIYGANNRLAQNIAANNYGAGIMLVGATGVAAASNTVLSQNSIYNNGTVTALNGAAATGQVGIDLQANGDNENAGTSPFVTLNSATTTGANGLLNYPVITNAYITGSNLVVSGYAKSGATIELFAAQANPASVNATGANFGQGRTYLTTVTEGSTTGVTDTDNRTGLSYSGNINGFNQGSDTNANGFTFTIPLSSLPGGTLAAGTVLTSTATLGGATSEFSGNATSAALSGYVYEDVNYGGGAGRPRSATGAVGRPNATVELYNGTTLVGTTTTDANGQYTFGATPGTYTVRVVNSTVSSSRTGYVAGLLPVQTYNGTTTAVGGVNPAFTDAAANSGNQSLTALTTGTTTPQSVATVTTTNAGTTGPDFGFNFDVVVNTNNTGQGSLRQFILNSNALGGEASLAQAGSNAAGALPTGTETSIFMIPNGTARPGLLASGNGGPASQLNASGVAVISPASILPTITGTNTSIDATTQTVNIGDTNGGTLGAGGTVGTGATALSTVNRPEVQLVGTRNFDGVVVGATNATVRGLSLYGFDHNITVNTDITAFLIEQNVVGTSATSFTDPGTNVRTLNEGILLNGADNGTVRNNLVGYNGGMGVWVLTTNGNGSNNNTISGNEIRGNAQESRPAPEGLVFDGLELQGNSTGNTVSGNLITANLGHGIDSFGNGVGGNTVSGNTISNNGVAVVNGTGEEGSGLRVFGATNPTIISGNVLSGNNGSGVLVIGSANQVTISQNSMSGNTRLGIDLIVDNSTPLFYNGNTGTTSNVTLNDNGDTDGGGNGQLNFPVLTTANVSGTSLVVNGYARPGSRVEFFLATPLTTDPTNNNRFFGQGSSFLISRTEGNATDDSNTGTGTYSGTINGVDQGTDNTNLFTFTIPLSSLTTAQRTALLSGNAILTSTATLNNSTSEFSGNLALPITDVTVALTGPQTVTPGQPTGTYTATFANNGPVTASTVTRTVTLPSGATNVVLPAGATLSGNVIDFGTVANLASGASNSFSFSFTPATTATGTVAITSNISTATSQGNNLAPDASTINATVAPTADVVTTIAATTASVAAGTPRTAGTPPTFTVTFNNNGPTTAAGVVAAVQLPTGLTNVVATNGGTYNSTTGIVSYTGLTSIASGSPTTSVITFDAPAAGPIAASATIATTTAEANQTANNQASATMAVVPAFDLLTTITGPTSAVAGDLVTLNVTTTNNGPSSAANAVQTVQIGQGLTNVYVSNGGVYNSTGTTQTIVSNGVSYSVPAGAVVFPTLASLATGQTVANTISFSMPNATITPTASVTPNTASSANTAGDTNTNNNAANLNAGTTGSTAASVTVLAPQAGTANAYTTITTSAATTTVGTPVTLTVTTGNNGQNAATGVTQTVQLMPGFTTSTIQVNGTTGTLSGNTITFGTGGPTYDTTTGLVTFPTLTNGANGSASGTSMTNTIRLTPSAATSTTVATTGNNGQILAMAGVRTTNTDPVAADNVASVGVTIAPSSDLATTITGPASALAGQSVTYTASFVNNGPMAAAGVTETAQLPTGLSSVTITDANGNAVSGASYNATTGLVTFPTLTSDASGATQVFKLTFAAPAQSFTPRSSIASTSTESAPANNSASVATSVAAAADLATLVSGPATAVVGNAVTYSVTTTNNGPVAATSATPTLQLPAGFDATTLRVNGTTGTLSGTTITYTFASGATATYSTTSGLVTFSTVGTLPNGTSVSNYVTFVMPNAAGGQIAGVASATASGTTDPVASNNSSSVATSIAPTTTTSADLVATLSASAATVAAGGSVTYTATYSNAGTDPAVNVVPTLQLLPGLTTATLPLVNGGTGTLSNGNITFSNGASYNQQSGVLTFPTITSQATGNAGNVSYTVQVVAPNNGPLLATAATTSNTSEPNTAAAQNNNAQSASVNITPSFNEVTRISGPTTAVAGTSQTYTVTTINNGLSATSNPTTQTVTVPAGQTPTNITGGGVYSSANNTITWTIPAGQSAGTNGAVANSFTIAQPTTATTLTASVTVTGESNTGDNSFAITTSPTNLAPLAYAVVNTLQNPQSNEAGGLATGLLISPLNASDPESSFATAKYTVVAIPSTAQGTLYYNNGGTYTAVTAGQTLTDAQAQTLRFKAATGYVGNASFTYLTTDAAGNTSPVVNYTIPVATDVDAAAYSLTPTKGGTNPYVAGDVIAYTVDTNGAVYNAATASVYQTNGTLQPTVAGSAAPTNGIAAANAVAGSITGPGTTTATTLSDIGLAVDATGRLVVDAAPNTSKLKAGSYSVQITTTDVNGGITTRTVAFTIGTNPLPVILSAFTASAVANRDAQLDWTTASEVNSAYFDVERSFDGAAFTKVGQLAAKGTSSTPTAYSLLDKGVASLAPAGTVYYRLKQVDLDGKFAYSPVRTVSFGKVTVLSLSLFPNPAQTSTSLDLRQLPAGGSYQVSLLDATGRVVRQLTLGGGQLQSLEVSSLASGSYIVLVTGTQPDGSVLRQSLRLTKE